MKWDKCAKEIKKLDEFPEESLLSRGILTEGALCLASISLMKQPVVRVSRS